MNRYTVTIGQKGRVTIPADVRRHLGLEQGDQVAFVLTDGETVELRRARFTLESVIGSIDALPGESLDLEREIEVATEEVTARKMKSWNGQ